MVAVSMVRLLMSIERPEMLLEMCHKSSQDVLEPVQK